MEYGFGVPNRGPLASPESIIELARRGEEMGFDIVSASDHIVVPNSINSRYPYSATGEFAVAASGHYLEQLAVLSFVANQTSSLRLLSSVMVLPLRSPVLTAKILATIDVLSKGRLIVGCGVGWMREEFEPIGAPPFDERGAVGDEYIRAFKELWTSDNPSFQGKYCSFSDITFLPKPVQKPHPPIWIGGESPPALRRAARLGDAWFPIGTNPRFPVGTIEQIAKYYSRVRGYARDAGRDPTEVGLVYRVSWSDVGQAQTHAGGDRRIMTGSAEQIAGDIGAIQELGAGRIMFDFPGDSVSQVLGRMEQFITQVRPLAG